MQTAITSDEARWAAVIAKDRAADDAFVYSVRTTGVYCRPSCAARPARRENVAFHMTTEAARAAGFRACKRCRPDEPPLAERYAVAVGEACRIIEAAEIAPSLATLSRRAGMSPYHFHRVFKSVAGVTPKAYAEAHRSRKVRQALTSSETVTDAIYDAGFNSGGRFYAKSAQVLGMTPTRFRAGGERATIRFAIGECSLGAILVAATEVGVCAILLGDDPEALIRDLQDRFDRATLVGGDGEFEALVAQVVGFVEQPRLGLDLPLDVRGTAFQEAVWKELTRIPAGETRTYSQIAAAVGRPKAVRAAGTANGDNNVAVLIPCHRVIRTDGTLGGYAYGLERKTKLLEKEARKG